MPRNWATKREVISCMVLSQSRKKPPDRRLRTFLPDQPGGGGELERSGSWINGIDFDLSTIGSFLYLKPFFHPSHLTHNSFHYPLPIVLNLDLRADSA